MTTTRVPRTTLRRQRRDDTRRQIVDAAAALLEERRWHDIPVEDVMAAAGLGRTAFYRHFGDRGGLLLALLEDVKAAVDAAGSTWKTTPSDDPVGDLRTGLAELTEVMRGHSRVLQAVVDEAAHDPEIERAREALIGYFTGATAARIEADVAAGVSQVEQPYEVASALVRMNESYLLAAFGRPPYPEPVGITQVIAEVWEATIYGRQQPGGHDAPAG